MRLSLTMPRHLQCDFSIEPALYDTFIRIDPPVWGGDGPAVLLVSGTSAPAAPAAPAAPVPHMMSSEVLVRMT